MANKFSIFVNNNIISLQILILSLLVINSNIHLPCLPEIQKFYSTSEHIVQMAFILNPFIALLSVLAFGITADLYGRKSILLFSLSCFILGTVLIINTNTIYLFFLGRFFQSLGDSGAAITSGIIIGDYYKGRTYARIQAILSIILSLMWAGSPLLGEKIFTAFEWQGNFTFIFIFSLLLIVPLVFWKEKKRNAMIDKNIFIKIKKEIGFIFNYSFLMLSLVQAFPLGVFTAFEYVIPFIYKESHGYSVKETSTVFFIFIIINVFGSLLYVLATHFIQIKKTFQVGTYILFFHFLFGLYFFNFQKTSIDFHIYMVFGLLSLSLPFILISATTQIVDTSSHHLGIAISVLTIIRNAGTTGIPLFCCLLSQDTFFSFFNYTLIFTVLALGLLVCILKK